MPMPGWIIMMDDAHAEAEPVRARTTSRPEGYEAFTLQGAVPSPRWSQTLVPNPAQGSGAA